MSFFILVVTTRADINSGSIAKAMGAQSMTLNSAPDLRHLAPPFLSFERAAPKDQVSI